VPKVDTRAKARAEFIRDQSGASGFVMGWSHVVDRRASRCRWLDDPFATGYGPWIDLPSQ
jgi:hypothetical protein